MKLMLAVDIADRLRDAGDFRSFDFENEARALLARHPEAHASVDEVIAAMRQDAFTLPRRAPGELAPAR
ncbi:hypothetical protein [Pelagibacterium luteolum]|nr:hypothetical protein [Pelagibacterium luteolum]